MYLKTSFALISLTIATIMASGCSGNESNNQNNKVMEDENIGPYQSKGLNRSGINPEIIRVMSTVPRHEFVPEKYKKLAYEDKALPIEAGQTISQPYIVALMTQEANIGPGHKVLEIGTGSGYQAAILSKFGASVYSIEIVKELADTARERLKNLGYKNIEVLHGDGWKGWPEKGPFDAILVTAAAPRPPKTLLAQLANRGRMIIPVERDDYEELLLIEKDDDDFITKNLGSVRFVPMTGQIRQEEPQRTANTEQFIRELEVIKKNQDSTISGQKK